MRTAHNSILYNEDIINADLEYPFVVVHTTEQQQKKRKQHFNAARGHFWETRMRAYFFYGKANFIKKILVF